MAKAITLLESTNPESFEQGQELLDSLLPHTGKALRIGITGVPGVGKSTFIEAFGLFLIELGHRVAVLAVDPSSPITGGSIMGCLLYTSPSPRDQRGSRMPTSA